MTEPERLVYRSNLLGSDKRVTNYGGGNTSSKIMREGPADRRDGRGAVGQGLGRRQRLDQARRLLDALHGQAARAEEALSRRRARRRDGGLPAALHLQPQPARRLDRHAAACLRAARPTSTTCIPTRSSPSPRARIRKALTKEIFGDEIGWLPWKRPGFELGLWLEKFCRRAPRGQGRHPRKPRAVHLGRHAEGVLRDDDRDHQPGDRLVRAARPPARRSSAARRSRRSPPAERRAIAARLMPAIRGLISARTATSSAISTIRRRCWSSSTRKNLRPLAALGTSCPDHFLRTKIRPLVVEFDPAKPDVDARDRARSPTAIEAYRAGLRGLLRALQARRTRRRCATPTRWSIWCPASACSPSPRTRRRRASRASSTSTPST